MCSRFVLLCVLFVVCLRVCSAYACGYFYCFVRFGSVVYLLYVCLTKKSVEIVTCSRFVLLFCMLFVCCVFACLFCLCVWFFVCFMFARLFMFVVVWFGYVFVLFIRLSCVCLRFVCFMFVVCLRACSAYVCGSFFDSCLLACL